MKCMYCQAEMTKSTVPFHIDRKGIHIRLEEVPAWVCSQCGESCFEAGEVDLMQALAKSIEEQTQHFSKATTAI